MVIRWGARALSRVLARGKWSAAAEHFCGDGLEQGQPSLQGYEAAKKLLIKHDRAKAAKLLTRAVAGGAAVGERLAKNTRCRSCGAFDTEWHRYFGCQGHSAGDDEFLGKWLQKTSWL